MVTSIKVRNLDAKFQVPSYYRLGYTVVISKFEKILQRIVNNMCIKGIQMFYMENALKCQTVD